LLAVELAALDAVEARCGSGEGAGGFPLVVVADDHIVLAAWLELAARWYEPGRDDEIGRVVHIAAEECRGVEGIV